MRAAVYRRYGGPSVVAVEELETPVPGAGRGARPGHGIRRQHHRRRDALGHAVRGAGCSPGRSARACACSARSSPASSPASATGVEAFRVGDAVWGVTGTGHARARRVRRRARGRRPRAAARRPRSRRCGGADRSDRAVVPRRHRRARRGADDPHQRRVRCGRHVGGPARGAPRRDRHGGVQRRARAARPRARRARGARLPRRRRRRDAARSRDAPSTWCSTCSATSAIGARATC